MRASRRVGADGGVVVRFEGKWWRRIEGVGLGL